MTSTPQSPLRPRLSGRDILPILASGLVVAGVYIAGTRSLTASGVGLGLQIGIGSSLALAGLQGRAEVLTVGRAMQGALRMILVIYIVLLANGRLEESLTPFRVTSVVAAALGASFLLFILRTRGR